MKEEDYEMSSFIEEIKFQPQSIHTINIIFKKETKLSHLRQAKTEKCEIRKFTLKETNMKGNSIAEGKLPHIETSKVERNK